MTEPPVPKTFREHLERQTSIRDAAQEISERNRETMRAAFAGILDGLPARLSARDTVRTLGPLASIAAPDFPSFRTQVKAARTVASLNEALRSSGALAQLATVASMTEGLRASGVLEQATSITQGLRHAGLLRADQLPAPPLLEERLAEGARVLAEADDPASQRAIARVLDASPDLADESEADEVREGATQELLPVTEREFQLLLFMAALIAAAGGDSTVWAAIMVVLLILIAGRTYRPS